MLLYLSWQANRTSASALHTFRIPPAYLVHMLLPDLNDDQHPIPLTHPPYSSPLSPPVQGVEESVEDFEAPFSSLRYIYIYIYSALQQSQVYIYIYI